MKYPLLLGLIWTLGTMGWLGIQISIPTAGIGAMILGLGVEYGVFMLTRYEEEKEHKRGRYLETNRSITRVSAGLRVVGQDRTEQGRRRW